ncbi:MAG TPA: hypothetical protein PKI32_00705 [Opitutales bacterium]|nr:hypothetical protein [Opitutales bacterium]
MQKLRPLLTALFMVVALFFGACTSHPVDKRIHASIIGTWQGEETGAILTIYGDGRFTLEKAAGVPEGTVIRGKLERGFDDVCIIYTTPASICQSSAGIYRLTPVDGRMEAEVLREDCPARAAQMDHAWKLLNMTPKPFPGK